MSIVGAPGNQVPFFILLDGGLVDNISTCETVTYSIQGVGPDG